MGAVLTLGCDMIPKINFAMQQNYIPFIRNLTVGNEGDEDISDVRLTIAFDPAFAKTFTYDISCVPSGKSVEISPLRIILSTEMLFSLTEAVSGTVSFSLSKDEKELYQKDIPVQLLAFNEWSGLAFDPELIAAFVTPNHPEIAKVISEASVYLKKWADTTAFSAYQRQNPNFVKQQMAALYAALCARRIAYNMPPASFEYIGQKIRLASTVLEQKQGTCLDLAVLYASCLEAVGLNPIIIFIEGHAFCGCHLEEETFADCATDDVSAIEKRIAAGAEELLLVECTDMTKENVDFDKSLKHGRDHMNTPGSFICAVDIARTRGSGIRPIPLRLEQALTAESTESDGARRIRMSAPSELDMSLYGKVAQGSNEPMTKQKIWERKLLDFSLRNSLLNFRINKSTVEIMVSDLSLLEDKLSDGTDFRILEAPSEWTVSMRDAKTFEIETDKDLVRNIAEQELKNKRIRTFMDAAELEESLKKLYRAAKVSMEENGSNTLFLSLGMLRWFESEMSEKARYAPLVLIPIDIVRNVRDKGYIIRSRQEDAQINVTMIEYLRQDHGIEINGLDPLPEDEHGIDLPLVFNTVRQAIMGKKTWNIIEHSFIGLFSFGQFVMWNDIRNRSDELKSNKVVSCLMEGATSDALTGDFIADTDIDSKISLTDIAVPVDADSSQLSAVAAASAGRSFVLHGPPGTGKSQTITNMIANALYHGKSVLFVAEKMAALSVVQKRLANIGIDPFCLELHSNKTSKSAVLAELNKSLETARVKSPEQHAAVAQKLAQEKAKLNFVIEALHEKRNFGESLYTAIERYEQCMAEKGKISIGRDALQNADEGTIARFEEIISEYVVAISEIGVYAQHPLIRYGGCEYSTEMRDSLKNGLDRLAEEYGGADEALNFIATAVGLDGNISREKLNAVSGLIDACGEDAPVINEILGTADFDAVVSKLKTLCETGKAYNALCAEIENGFDKAVLSYPAQSARVKWKQAEAKWFLPKLIGQNRLYKELKVYSKNPAAFKKSDVCPLYDRLIELSEKSEQMGQIIPTLNITGGILSGTATDWDMLSKAVHKTEAVYGAAASDSFSDSEKQHIMNVFVKCSPQEIAGCAKNLEAVRSYTEKSDRLAELYSVNTEFEESADWLTSVNSVFKAISDNISLVKSKAAFNLADKRLCDAGLAAVSRAYKNGTVSADNIRAAYHCELYYQLALMTIAADKRLASFNGKQYDALIDEYRRTIKEYQRLTMQELAARLSANIPVSDGTSAASSEMGILKKAIKNNGRMMPLRKLFDQIPTLLRRLCPCMLMSPISVAQYIDPSFPKFDLVIFDEASQLPTSEAVGTIARGENVVIVGDPKQLPPTSFFTSNRIDEDNSELEDLESLLDDCLAISMPQMYLKWHYRSRHESLIAYSNMKYYDNKLYTFPSPNDLVSQVRLIRPEGFYDKGKTKQNKAEAEAIVNEIIRRLSDEKLRNDSIGVVTFSSVQQNLIDDMLVDAFAKNPDIADFDAKCDEPVFIKNLENVQGDERDVILFSVGYGPDENGKVSMNFGPLNRDGGWRRLNVAISRARKEMIVYSVLRPEQIDLTRTRSEGVAGLKGFLEFATRGTNVIAGRTDMFAKADDSLVSEIAKGIETLGYKTRCNIGCSQFRMDIGIIDPEKPETYILGIMLDGENCHRSATARDRFAVQPGVLEGLGWSVMRVWTLDWLDDSNGVLQHIKQAVENAQHPQEKPVGEVKTKQAPVFETVEKTPAPNKATLYETADIAPVGTPEQFYLPETVPVIQSLAVLILSAEAPISRNALVHKLIGAWGITRSGDRTDKVLADVFRMIDKRITIDENNAFFWLGKQNPDTYDIYRPADIQGNRRELTEIPSEEIISAMTEVLSEQIGLSRADLIRETAKKFGYTRLGTVMTSTVEFAVDKAVSGGKIKNNGDRYTL